MAQTQLYFKKAQMHGVVESTVDTYVAPSGSGTGMWLAENIAVSYEGDNYVPDYARGDYLAMDESPGMLASTIEFEVPIKGKSVGVAPEFAPALKACGLKETIVAVTSVAYSPHSAFDGAGGNPGQSYSFSWLVNGLRHSIKGACGTYTLTAVTGVPGRLKFSMKGAYNAVADDGLEAPTYDTTKAPSFLGASFSTNFGGVYVPKGIRNLSFDLGNRIAMGQDCNETAGYYGARIVGRKSSGSFDPEATLVATKAWHTAQRAGTSGTITTGAVGSAGSQWTLSIGRCILRPITFADRDGIAAFGIPFGVSSLNTDVEGTALDVTLLFT